MEHSALEAVEKMKAKLFSPSANLFALLPPVSAYETAWVAMVPDPEGPTRPMFPECLDWVLRNQNLLGFWVDDHVSEQHELINKHQWNTADLTATLACLIALKTWEAAGFSQRINKGLRFLRENMGEELIRKMRNGKESGDEAGLYRLSLMVELAEAKGLKVSPTQQNKNGAFDEIKMNGTQFKREEDDEIVTESVIMKEIAFENNGSTLFRSPSATACAFIITGGETCRTYLHHLISNCQKGVPPMYLEDNDVLKLCVVDHLERLGCAEQFNEEIRNVMERQYRFFFVPSIYRKP